jgi:MFS family permease
MTDNTDRLWTTGFICACVANFMTCFSFFLLMPTLPFYLVERFAAGKSLIGILVSGFIISALLTRPFSAYLVDKFSRKTVYLISFVFFVASYAGYFVAGSVLSFLFLRLWHGVTWGAISTSGNTVAIDIMPSRKRGEGIGFYGMAATLSVAAGPMVGLFLYNRYDFNLIFYTAMISGIIGLVAASFIKVTARVPFKHPAVSLDRFISVKGIPIGINLVLLSVSYGMVLSFAAMYGKEIGVENAGLFFMLMALGTAGSRTFIGKWIDRGKIHQVTLSGAVIIAVSFILFTFYRTSSIYYISAFTIGIGWGILFPSFQTLFVNIVPHNQRGTANSTFFTSLDTGVGGGIYLAGKVSEISSLSNAFGLGALAGIFSIFYYIKISAPIYDRHKLQ